MTWFKNNYATLLGALVLSLLTVGMLSERSGTVEPTPVTLYARFMPRVIAEVGSLQYRVDDRFYTDTIPVQLTGDPAQIQALQGTLTCRPTLDEARFNPDEQVRETSIEIRAEDFDLAESLTGRIAIKPVRVEVLYARLLQRERPIKATPADIIAGSNPRYRVDAVRVEPPTIRVKIPADKVNLYKELPIKPISMAGRFQNFTVPGAINTDVADVKTLEAFYVSVDISLIQHRVERDGVRIYLSNPPLAGFAAELVDLRTTKVVLEGPKDLVDAVHADQIHVFVKLDWTPETQPGDVVLPLRLDLADETLRKQIRITLAAGEAPVAVVRVTRK